MLLEYPTNLINLTEVDLVVCASYSGHMVAIHTPAVVHSQRGERAMTSVKSTPLQKFH